MKHTNIHNLPPHLVEALIKDTYDIGQNEEGIISMTQLISPPRIYQLKKRYWADLEEDVADGLWRLLGSAVHEVLGRINKENRTIEERQKIDVMGLTVAGRPDLYENGTIIDHKITSVWSVSKEKEEWVNQLNGYAWFFRSKGLKVEKGEINAILRDWRKAEATKYPKSYPQIPFKTLPIKIWSFNKQEDYIMDRVALHVNAFHDDDDKLPVCTEEERWKDRRCKDYCIVNKHCSYWLKKYGNKKRAKSLKVNEL